MRIQRDVEDERTIFNYCSSSKEVIFRKVFANIYEISNRIENLKEIVIIIGKLEIGNLVPLIDGNLDPSVRRSQSRVGRL